ncbi:MAG: hypothetical protein U1F23_09510 [Lysobacterales bacterium]
MIRCRRRWRASANSARTKSDTRSASRTASADQHARSRVPVMDYPAPRIELVDGHLGLGDAYGVGVGK